MDLESWKGRGNDWQRRWLIKILPQLLRGRVLSLSLNPHIDMGAAKRIPFTHNSKTTSVHGSLGSTGLLYMARTSADVVISYPNEAPGLGSWRSGRSLPKHRFPKKRLRSHADPQPPDQESITHHISPPLIYIPSPLSLPSSNAITHFTCTTTSTRDTRVVQLKTYLHDGIGKRPKSGLPVR